MDDHADVRRGRRTLRQDPVERFQHAGLRCAGRGEDLNEIFAAAADIWREVAREDVARKHASLTGTLIAVLEQECGALGVEIDSPKEYERRGGHVSFRHPGAGPVCEALVDHGLLCSFRYPASIRLGLSPLYHRHEDVWRAVQILKDVLAREAWRDPKYERVSI